jgi:hypothetical protein
MRAPALVIVLASSAAWADRTPVVAVGGVMDLRFRGEDYQAAQQQQDPDIAAGPRIMLTFENAPVPLTAARGKVAVDARLVPELFGGAFFGSNLGEAYAGAGLRGELQMATWKARLGSYFAPRGFVIGRDRNAAAEFAVGEYVQLTDKLRLGWEGAAVVRLANREGDKEVDCLVNLYAGWRL